MPHCRHKRPAEPAAGFILWWGVARLLAGIMVGKAGMVGGLELSADSRVKHGGVGEKKFRCSEDGGGLGWGCLTGR